MLLRLRKKIGVVCGQNALSEEVTQRLFCRFCSRNFYVKDAPRSTYLVTEKVYKIAAKVKHRHVGSHRIVRNITADIDHLTVLNHLMKAD